MLLSCSFLLSSLLYLLLLLLLIQAELLVIDEAASIPLPIVKTLLGNYLVFLSSTITGYEGTGRSLSLKLLAQLREQQQAQTYNNNNNNNNDNSNNFGNHNNNNHSSNNNNGRVFREVVLVSPIRYADGDKCEQWLHQLLCLDATEHLPRAPVTR